ncbi:MAG: DNA repair protein RecO [Phycisphaerae bacterium]
MATITDDAIVLRQLEYSETSQIAVLLTAGHGKVRAIAKGVRRTTKTRFSPGLDLLDVGKASFSTRSERQEGLSRLFEFKQTVPLIGIRDRLTSVYGALYMVDMVAVLTEDWDPHRRTFAQLLRSLHALASGHDVLPAIVDVQVTFLEEIGSLPRFGACVSCGDHTSLGHFSSLAGGVLCDSCHARQRECRPLSEKTLQALQDRRWAEASLGCFRLFDYHLSHLMGRASRLSSTLLRFMESSV